MANIGEITRSAPAFRLGPKRQGRPPALLPDSDYRRLHEHLEQCEAADQPARPLLAHVLDHKIRTTRPAGDAELGDVVTGGCRVTYSVDGAPSETGLLVHRARSDLGSGVIPVASLLGATLIGMQVGQRAPLLFEDGRVGAISVLAVPQSI